MRKLYRAVLFYCIAPLVLTCAAAGPESDATRLINEALKPSSLETNLRHLTDEIGGRVPGTPAMQRAVEWGVEAFKTAGADSAHTEDFMTAAPWAEG